MLDILNGYLVDAAPNELRIVISEACDAFDKLDLPNYEDGFTDILMANEDVDIADTVPNIVNYITSLQKQILKEHQVELVEDTSISTYTIFINGIFDISNFTDKQLLLKTASLELDTCEVFAEVLSLVTNKTTEELLFSIETVSPFCIGSIKDLAEDIVEELPEVERVVRLKHITDFNTYCDYIKTRNLDIVKMIESGLDVGFPFIMYADIIGRDLESKSIERAAQELFGMAVISSDGCQNPAAIINENIDKYISNIDTVTRITMLVTDYVLGLQIGK